MRVPRFTNNNQSHSIVHDKVEYVDDANDQNKCTSKKKNRKNHARISKLMQI